MLLAGGCSEPGPGPRPMTVTLATWQHAVEQYVRDQGNGDPNILRDATLPTSQRGFALIGEADIEHSTDASGLLLGHRQIAGRTWFIYLVGLIQQGVVRDIRLVGLSWSPNKTLWQVSPPNPNSLQRYENVQPNGALFSMFPAKTDHFKLSTTHQSAVAIHRQSGASWELKPAPPK
ncbi:MAG TPA: hypothetical protein VFW23_08085 [Tepidisphaeraceae bacterium]|nr:hypothetical protein [Tepidisphaeraceae bacterium]